MSDDRCRLGSDDVVIGLDLASAEHQAVVLTAAGQRLTRFRIPHTRAGLEELLRRTTPAALGRAEATDRRPLAVLSPAAGRPDLHRHAGGRGPGGGR